MPNLTYEQICNITQELSSVLTGGMVQKIRQPQKDFVLLLIRRPQVTHQLFICLQQQNNTMYLTNHSWTNPPTPLFFCQTLRKYLMNSYVEQVSVVENDRLVMIKLISKKETGHVHRYYVYIELWGNCGNMYLLSEEKHILNTMHPCNKPNDYFKVVEKSEGISGKSKKDFLEPLVDTASGSLTPWNIAADAFFTGRLAENLEHKGNQAVTSFLNKEKKKLARKAEKLRGTLKEAEGCDELRICGELLKSHLHLAKKGLAEIKVTNYYSESGNDEFIIPLDCKRDAKENMAHYFKKYRKFTNGIPYLQKQISKAEDEITQIEIWLEQISNNSLDPKELPKKWQSQLFPQEDKPGKKENPEERNCYYKFTSQDDWNIFVGRGSRDNDMLTFKVAKGNDLWLHTEDYPGAHVVIPKRNNKEIPERTIIDAAQLAVHYSKAKDHNKVSISYTSRKNVSKPKKSKPGLVYLASKKNIILYPDKERIAQLMDTRE